MSLLTRAAHWLSGATILIGCELLGRGLAAWLPIAVPGSVIGMLLLLIGLMIYGRVPLGLALVSEQLLRMLVLIFLPAAVGIYFLRDLSGGDWVALFTAMTLGTIITLTLSALLLNALISRSTKATSQAEAGGDD